LIDFLNRFYPLLDGPTRRKTWWASGALVGLAGLEAVALIALVPLMQILTAPDLRPDSSLVSSLSDLFGNPPAGRLALFLGVFTLSVYVAKCLAGIAIMRWTTTFTLAQESRFVHRLMRAYLHAPYRLHLEHNSAEFVRTLTTSSQLVFRSAFVQSLSALGDMFSIVFLGVVLAATDPLIAAVAAVYFAAVSVIYQRSVHHAIRRAALQIHEQQAVDFGTIHQSLSGVKEIKVRGAEEHFADEVYALRRGLVPAFRTMTLIGVTPRYVLELAMVGAAALVSLVAFSTQSVASAVATLGVFLAGGFRMLGPLNKVIFAISQAKGAIPAVDQMRNDVDSIASVPTGRTTAPELKPPVLRPHILMNNVSFSYTPGVRVLEDISLEIHPGEAIGLVGGSGAGKSTLVDILLGLLDPDSGEVVVDLWALSSVRRQWQQMIGYVPQAIALFDDTVKANVALGVSPDQIDEARLWEALETAQLDTVVRALPLGIEQPIGEAGVQLSGGQRQRLGIARAMYPDPAVLMFDEATSALDNETEFKLTEVLERFRGQLTTITIAHRLSTVRRCDRLFYLESGSLVAEGSFSALDRAIPGFARMVELAGVGGA
jgi:ATP-binding cassette, subfamily B, bacterial PglK